MSAERVTQGEGSRRVTRGGPSLLSSDPGQADAGIVSSEVVARVARLCEIYELSGAANRRFECLLATVAADRRAPTTVRAPQRAVEVHVADSLAALSLPAVRRGRRVVDLGAGAGFPGLPLAIACPDARFTLLEATRRKCDFLQDLVAELGLGNADVVCDRAESWSSGFGKHDLVVARAVAAQAVVLEYAAPLLALGGTLVEWRGERDAAGEADAIVASAQLGLRPVEVIQVEPAPQALNHHLHVFAKDAPTPAIFPRRPGIALKRPLRDPRRA